MLSLSKTLAPRESRPSRARVAPRSQAFAAALAAVLVAPQVRAQTDEAGAQTMIRRGLIDAMQSAQRASNWPQCVEMGQRAAAIRETSSLRRVLADCQQSARQYTGAMASAELCLSMARRDPPTPQRDTIIASCEQLQRDAQTHIGRVTVVVPEDAPADLSITLAGRALTRAAWGVPALVDADTSVVIAANAQGYTPFRAETTVAAATIREIRVELVRRPPATGAAVEGPRPPAVRVPPPTRAPEVARAPRRTSFRVTPLFAVGIATTGAGIVTAAVGWAVALSTAQSYERRCVGAATTQIFAQCDGEYERTQSSIDAAQTAGAIGVGLVAVGAGLSIWGAIAGMPSSEARAGRWTITPMASSATRGLAFVARW
ncbi:MAG: hypothetical protein JNK05_28535 [Myxococcales bacterium]|nr:hypothetical protein [Myxococcales bacterium]